MLQSQIPSGVVCFGPTFCGEDWSVDSNATKATLCAGIFQPSFIFIHPAVCLIKRILLIFSSSIASSITFKVLGSQPVESAVSRSK